MVTVGQGRPDHLGHRVGKSVKGIAAQLQRPPLLKLRVAMPPVSIFVEPEILDFASGGHDQLSLYIGRKSGGALHCYRRPRNNRFSIFS